MKLYTPKGYEDNNYDCGLKTMVDKEAGKSTIIFECFKHTDTGKIKTEEYPITKTKPECHHATTEIPKNLLAIL